MAADFPRLALRLLGAFFALLAFALAFLVTFFTDFLPGLFDLERERERVFEPDLERDRVRDRDRERERDRDRDFFALSLNEVPLLTRAFDLTPRAKATLSCIGETFFVPGCDVR